MNTSTNLFDLYRDPFGTWMLRTAQGHTHERVTVVRPFPISAPSESVSILSQDGRELVWVDRLADLPGPLQETLIEALTQREFMPEILRLVSVSSYATPSTWVVQTDRGTTELVLKGEEDIRRQAPNVKRMNALGATVAGIVVIASAVVSAVVWASVRPPVAVRRLPFLAFGYVAWAGLSVLWSAWPAASMPFRSGIETSRITMSG